MSESPYRRRSARSPASGREPRLCAARLPVTVADQPRALQERPDNELIKERLFELFDERYINRLPVILTCDVLPGQLSDVVGPRVASRLAEMCRNSVVLLQGDDRRKEIAA